MEREMQTLFELEYQQEVIEYMHEMDVSPNSVLTATSLRRSLMCPPLART